MKPRWPRVLGALAVASSAVTVGGARPAAADSYVPISGAGSTWAQNAIDQFRRDVSQYGMRINYAGTGSSDGRRQFLNGTVDFAASDIAFQFKPDDGSAPENPAAGSYAYMPITAGGTAMMYNLTIAGQRVTNLRLSGTNLIKVFTGGITMWNDPAVVADNPGLTLPAVKVVPVVRSDGSGSTAQFTGWMINQHPDIWNAYCARSGRAPACGQTSNYPTIPGEIAQSGDLGVAGYVAQNYANGAIGYVNYSYALNAGFPVVKLLNASGYFTEPTPNNVAVSLLKAQINTDASSPDYLTQQLSGVYSDIDPRTYPLSSYSYLILPTIPQGQFTPDKGKTLAAFSYYAMCQGQQESASLGYSPMPINLVQASFDQIKKVPGAVVQSVNIQGCHNPTFTTNGTNQLADNAPQPQACDKQGPTQCATGTGGDAKTPTSVAPSHSGAGGAGGAGGTGGTGTGGTGGTGTGGTGGTGGTSGTTVPLSSDPNTTVCNADTGGCSQAPNGSSVAFGVSQASPTAVTLAAGSGWTSTQTLMVLVGILTIGLILAPGITSRILAKKRRP